MRILIATPTYGDNIHASTARQIWGLSVPFHERGIELDWLTTTDTYVEIGRNRLAHMAVSKGFDALFFVDSDVLFDTSHAMALVDAKLPIVAGLYPQKKINWKDIATQVKRGRDWKLLSHVGSTQIILRPPELHGKPLSDPNEPMEVVGAATGFMLIDRLVLDTIRNEDPNRTYWDDKIGEVYDYFWNDRYIDGAGKRRVRGEDIHFCSIAKQHGFSTFVLPKVNLGHTGVCVYQGCGWCATGEHPIHVPKEST